MCQTLRHCILTSRRHRWSTPGKHLHRWLDQSADNHRTPSIHTTPQTQAGTVLPQVQILLPLPASQRLLKGHGTVLLTNTGFKMVFLSHIHWITLLSFENQKHAAVIGKWRPDKEVSPGSSQRNGPRGLMMYAALPTKSPPSATMMLSSDISSSRRWRTFKGFKWCSVFSLALALKRKAMTIISLLKIQTDRGGRTFERMRWLSV